MREVRRIIASNPRYYLGLFMLGLAIGWYIGIA